MKCENLRINVLFIVKSSPLFELLSEFFFIESKTFVLLDWRKLALSKNSFTLKAIHILSNLFHSGILCLEVSSDLDYFLTLEIFSARLMHSILHIYWFVLGDWRFYNLTVQVPAQGGKISHASSCFTVQVRFQEQ